MIKTMMGLGVLSIPSVFDTLGLIPGIICLIAIALITTWASIQIQHFKINHPSIYGVDDAGQMMVGRIGREILYAAFIVGKFVRPPPVLGLISSAWIMVAGSGMISTSIALNAVSTHGTCSAVFTAVAAICTFLLASIRTLNKISWLAWIGTASILIASKQPLNRTRTQLTNSSHSHSRCWSRRPASSGTSRRAMDTGLQAVQEPSFPLCYRCYRISHLCLWWYSRHVLCDCGNERT